MQVAVVIPCHNYGRFLGECLDSVLAQSLRPPEIFVVDDASDDETPAVAATYSEQGVQYLRTEHRHCHLARRDGFDRTRADAVLFLDADNTIPRHYLRNAVRLLSDRSVGLVYADLHHFGLSGERKSYPSVWDAEALERDNFVDACAVYRRQALVVAQAFDGPTGHQAFADWTLAKRVSRAGFVGRKNRWPCNYRVHGANLLPTTAGMPYYDRAWLETEQVTLFVPLSGRTEAWHSHLRPWLDDNDWPRDRCRLVLADTSQDEAFGAMVRGWLAQSDYAAHDARYYRQSVAPPGLADAPRGSADNTAAVNDACRRIYNRMARDLSTAYVLVVEDDHRPPPDTIRKLMRGMDEQTVAVSGLYLNRKASTWGGVVAWKGTTANRNLGPAPGPPIEITGSGFGTLLLRQEALACWTFARHGDDEVFYDNAFAVGVQRSGRKYKLARNVLVEHLGAPGFDTIAPDSATSLLATEKLQEHRMATLAIANTCPHRSRDRWHAQCLDRRRGVEGHWVVTAEDCAACPHRGVA